MHIDELDQTFGPITNWDSIEIFHENFGIRAPKEPVFLSEDISDFRVRFMQEELDEYRSATTLEDKIDALIDLVVVAMGTAFMHGFNWESHWNEVFVANMNKVRTGDASQTKRKHQLDISKPPGWKAPNHKQYLPNSNDDNTL